LVEQDYLRRIVLREHDVPDGANIGLIAQTVRYALHHEYHVILEGILYTAHYEAMLEALVRDHRGEAYHYYFDISFEETVRRHTESPRAGDFTPAQMRAWYIERDLLKFLGLRWPDRTAFEEQEAQDRAQETEFKELRLKALVSLVFAAIGMVISMPVMSAPHGGEHGEHGAVTGDPFMSWVHGVIDPWLSGLMPWLYQINVQWLGYVLLAMTVVTMGWAGRHFYTRAWAAFRHHAADMNTLVAVGTGAGFLFSVDATFFQGFFQSRIQSVRPRFRFYHDVQFRRQRLHCGELLTS
jgi:cation transport ATPase